MPPCTGTNKTSAADVFDWAVTGSSFLFPIVRTTPTGTVGAVPGLSIAFLWQIATGESIRTAQEETRGKPMAKSNRHSNNDFDGSGAADETVSSSLTG